jgi:glutathione synthase/RimK-type ligase-like ATP-grasp enzyme
MVSWLYAKGHLFMHYLNSMNQTFNNISNIRCLVKACHKLGIQYEYFDDNHNFVGIKLQGMQYFANATTPWNNQSVAKICKDKDFSYRLLHDVIHMPHTMSFLNPGCDERYRKYLCYSTYSDIVTAISKKFSLPVIIKKNSGAQGANVFLCHSPEEITTALHTIYDTQSHLFDYVALAQEYVPIAREFRVIFFHKKIVLIYEKDISNAVFTGNLSPLHHENSRAVLINDQKLIARIQNFIMPMFSKLDVCYAGLDIVLTAQDKLYLLEINSHPGFEHFINDNGDEPLEAMFYSILLELSPESANVYYYDSHTRRTKSSRRSS